MASRTPYKTFAAHSNFIPKTVSFPCGTASIVGHLYLPDNYNPTQRYPAVAVGGSLSSVKEMMAGTYAAEMARRGVMAVSIDYRNYGQSDGAIRQYEDPASKAADLSAAVEYLASRSDVAGTGLLGICTSGGNVLYSAAADPRVKAVATVVGFFPSLAMQPALYGGEEGQAVRRAAGRTAQQLYDSTGEITLIPVYSKEDAMNPGPRPYYDDPARGGIPEWRNEIAVASWGSLIDFDPISQAAHVTTPTLMIHSEKAAFPDQARAVYNKIGPRKEIIWMEGGHFDFYDDFDTVQSAADKLAVHFRAFLS